MMSTRRAVLQAAAAAAALGALGARGQMLPPGMAAGAQAAWGRTQPYRDAAEAAAAYGRWDEVVAALEALIGEIRAGMGSDGPPLLAIFLPRYANALLEVGRVHDAERAAREALQLQAQMPPLPAGIRGMRATLSMAQDMARSMNRQMMSVAGADGSGMPAAMYRGPRPTEPATILALACSRQRRSAEVLRMWKGPFAAYLAQTDQLPEEARAAVAFSTEVEAMHMANALASTMYSGEARRAIRIALEANRMRLASSPAGTTAVTMQMAVYEQRRRLASALAGQVLLAAADQAAIRELVRAVVTSKGMGVRYLTLRRRVLASGNPRLGLVLNRLNELEDLARQIGTTGPAAVYEWGNWMNACAAAVAPAMPAFAQARIGALPEPEQLLAAAAARLDGAAWIGFVQYEAPQYDRLPATQERYLRYTILDGRMTVRDIGARRTVDRAVTVWRTAIAADRTSAAGQELASILLGDLDGAVAQTARWVIEPDGMLSLVPIEALPQQAGNLVLHAHAVRYATSLAQFAEAPTEPERSDTGEAAIVANPSFAQETAPAIAVAMRTGTGRRLRDLKLQPLPETEREAGEIARILSGAGVTTRLEVGARATAQALRFAQAPRFLHVATHGFVLAPDVEADHGQAWRITTILPGLLAGLALAPDRNGSFVMAEDMAGLNLRGTQLVVLSACDTGNGEVDVGEGVASLRRSLEEAGARASLTSLWPVPSEATVALMTRLYRELAAGLGHSDALRAAKLALQDGGAPPRDWAGFVLAGADR